MNADELIIAIASFCFGAFFAWIVTASIIGNDCKQLNKAIIYGTPYTCEVMK